MDLFFSSELLNPLTIYTIYFHIQSRIIKKILPLYVILPLIHPRRNTELLLFARHSVNAENTKMGRIQSLQVFNPEQQAGWGGFHHTT